ncbi:hypothetical protein SAMN05216204_11246 [Massilia yuzhufengensis]|uniref:Uncharacterized protein n=1 Tax=Massilia yuzhufengensis TaxID=1164594 RepID=A0A1I1NCF8_9BURK|nr:hypothetical protein SAMN05216204_11246 [Massilia yuzhufengensis]
MQTRAIVYFTHSKYIVPHRRNDGVTHITAYVGIVCQPPTFLNRSSTNSIKRRSRATITATAVVPTRSKSVVCLAWSEGCVAGKMNCSVPRTSP